MREVIQKYLREKNGLPEGNIHSNYFLKLSFSRKYSNFNETKVKAVSLKGLKCIVCLSQCTIARGSFLYCKYFKPWEVC